MRNAPAIVAALVAAVVAGSPALAERAGSPRLRAALILDASMSMNEQDPDRLAEVAARLLVDLATAADEVTLIAFGTTARTLGRERVGTDEARRALAGWGYGPGSTRSGRRRGPVNAG
jgi:hypothetical protein